LIKNINNVTRLKLIRGNFILTEWLLEILQIIIADIVLSGDNALIIGMAASAVPEQHRKKVIFIGLMAAAVLRILFAFLASYLISIPGLLLLGGLLLFWVCWKFYQDIKEFSSNKENDEKLKNDVSGKGLKAALITIIIADVSMSLDNVIAITAIARDDKTLLILGIAFAILLMAFFATAIVNLLTKFRWLSYLGLAFLIYLSGKMTFDGWLQIYPFLIA
jgi:YjbE family integral membrane protein